MKQLLQRMFVRAHDCNIANIKMLAAQCRADGGRVCDLGAGDGTISGALVADLRFEEKHAVELDETKAALLENSGYTVYRCDLNAALPLPSDFYDLVIANQVIEHLYDTDLFLEEVYRIVRPGGCAVISTENLASWHNVASLVFGWQPFSLTNVTGRRGGIGNPFALLRSTGGAPFFMQHHRLFTSSTLKELMALHGFGQIKALGAGYYPLPAAMGRFDARHAHFISVAGRKDAAAAIATVAAHSNPMQASTN